METSPPKPTIARGSGFLVSRLRIALALALAGFALVGAYRLNLRAGNQNPMHLPPAQARAVEVKQPEGEVIDIPEVEPEERLRAALGGIGFAESEQEPDVSMMAQAGEPKKQPAPIIDFDPPNPLKDKKGPSLSSAPPLPAASTQGPRPLLPFGSRQVRLPLLGDPTIAAQGNIPLPTGAEADHYKKYVNGLIDPNNSLDLIQGRARLLILKTAPKRIQTTGDGVITCTTSGDGDVTIVGNSVGTTVLNIWLPSIDDKTREALLSYVVRVAPDPDAKHRVERAYQALEREINLTFPHSDVQLKLVGDVIVITGQAADTRDAELINRVVIGNAPGSHRHTGEPRSAGHPRVVDLLRIVGGQPGVVTAGPEQIWKCLESEINRAFPSSQVQLGLVGDAVLVSGHVLHRREAAQILRVVAANLGKECCLRVIDRLEVHGCEQVMLKVVIAEVNRAGAAQAGACCDLPQQACCMENGRASLALHTLKRLNCARTLAEPNLVTLDGQPASFESGLVQLSFTPTILGHDRIRLEVAAGLNAGEFNSRGFSSTIEVSAGQTFTVAGLIQSCAGAGRVHLPFLRNVSQEHELVILITPELVKQSTAKEVP